MKINKCLINGKDYSSFLPYPYKETKVLDESLDNASFELINLNEATEFRPLTPVYLEITDGISTEKRYAVVVNDNISENIQLKKYNHQIGIMEETKCLERFLIGGKTITNPLIQDFTEIIGPPFYIQTEGITEEWRIAKYSSPFNINESLKIVDLWEDISGWPTNKYCKLYDENNTLLYYIDLDSSKNPDANAFPQNFNFNKVGTYSLEYHIDHGYFDRNPQTLVIKIDVIRFVNKPSVKMLDKFIETLLETAEALYKGEQPRYKLNEKQLQEFTDIATPEFALSNQMTLWEALSVIGGYLHAIPRLRNSILYFDEVGGAEELNFDASKYSINETSWGIEQYCSSIVSTVDNLVNFEQEGAISEPGFGYQTLRTESGQAYVLEDNLIIKTQFPIEKVIKLECGYLNDDNNTLVGDITPFVYEKAEYDLLSSYDETYPYAKCYAIYFVQGEPNIQGLQFKANDSITNVGDRFKNYAIQNIIERKTGLEQSIIDKIFGSKDDFYLLQNLMFRVTYIPIVSTQVEQTKQSKNELIFTSEIAYNQNSNLINSQAYGENMKGVVARLGNVEIVRTYIVRNLHEIPKIGGFVKIKGGDYYISNMIIEYYQTFIQVQIGFSKDFQRWNEYVGIKNNLRYYEVSEKQSLTRYCRLKNYCIVGDKDASDGLSAIKVNGINKIINQFCNNLTSDNEALMVIATTKDEEENEIKTVSLPLISLGFGTSLFFGTAFQDSYAAGDKIVMGPTPDTENIRTLQAVEIGDDYGEAKYLSLDYIENYPVPTNYTEMKKYGDALPEINSTENASSVFSINDYIFDKDSREVPNVGFFVHFITNDNDIILGPALTTTSKLVTNITTNYQLYISPYKVKKFVNQIDLKPMTLVSNAISSSNITLDDENNPKQFHLGEFTPPVDGEAWVIVNIDDAGKATVVMAKNKKITKNMAEQLPHFTFTRRLQEET